MAKFSKWIWPAILTDTLSSLTERVCHFKGMVIFLQWLGLAVHLMNKRWCTFPRKVTFYPHCTYVTLNSSVWEPPKIARLQDKLCLKTTVYSCWYEVSTGYRRYISTSINDGSTLITAGSYLITSITSFAVPPICRNFSLTGLTWMLSSGRNISGSARYQKKKSKPSPILRSCRLSSVTKTHILWASLNTWPKWKQNDTIMTFHYILFISVHSDAFHSLQLVPVHFGIIPIWFWLGPVSVPVQLGLFQCLIMTHG